MKILPTRIETIQDVKDFANKINSTVELSEDFIWCFLTEWAICMCPYSKSITRANRKALIKEMFNF